MAINIGGYEFDLTIRKYGFKSDPYYNPVNRREDEKPEVIEELKFNSLSSVEVIRKLLDYITSKQ